MSAAMDLARYLEAEGFSAVRSDMGDPDPVPEPIPDWTLYVSREPTETTEPDNVITLYDTGGAAPANYSINLRQPTIQVRVRCGDYQEGMAKQEEIFAILNAVKTQVIGGWTVLGVHLTTDFLSVGRTDSDKHIITANYQVLRGRKI